jgi:hypothetical protein
VRDRARRSLEWTAARLADSASGCGNEAGRHHSDEMRAVVESEWPELAHKLPPRKLQGGLFMSPLSLGSQAANLDALFDLLTNGGETFQVIIGGNREAFFR